MYAVLRPTSANPESEPRRTGGSKRKPMALTDGILGALEADAPCSSPKARYWDNRPNPMSSTPDIVDAFDSTTTPVRAFGSKPMKLR